MRTKARLFDEFAAAFQFPIADFQSWFALQDCLECLDEWLPASRYVVYITDADQMLADDDQEEWRWLLMTLHELGEYWSKPIVDNGRFNRESTPFHALLKYSFGNFQPLLHNVSVALEQLPNVQVDGLY